jgi:hypothetical protein
MRHSLGRDLAVAGADLASDLRLHQLRGDHRGRLAQKVGCSFRQSTCRQPTSLGPAVIGTTFRPLRALFRVSALCRALYQQVEIFRARPLEGTFPYLWLDAKVVKVRDRGHVYPKALVIAYATTQVVAR